MHQHMAYRSNTKVATDPSRKIIYSYIIFAVILLTLLIGSASFPAWRDQLFLKSPDILRSLSSSPFSFIVAIFIQAILIWPFLNIPASTWFCLWPFGGKWKNLELDRQLTSTGHLNGQTMMTHPLPETLTPLSTTLAVRMRRNWRATWIAGAVYAPLLGIVLWMFISGWQINLQYLGQQGELSAWTLLGSIPYTLAFCLGILPAPLALLLAPRQHIIATQDGLIGYRGLRLRSIPWQEARLFALIDKQETLIYELSSRTSIIRWSSKPAWGYGDTYPTGVIGIAPLGLTRAEHSTEEYSHQIQQLTAMVAARTGLPLYDLCSQAH